jgi:glutaredoxin 3
MYESMKRGLEEALEYSIKANKMFVIYSKDNCVYCEKAKKLLEKNNMSYEELKYERDFTRDELLGKFPQARTFPQIETTDGDYVGGYDQLAERLG